MMRIVVDTNVLASAVFFDGKPGELLRLILTHSVFAVATQEILDEYQDTIDYLLEKYKGRELHFSAVPIFSAMEIIPAKNHVAVCRDPDDDKFISCALDGQCYYVVSGDKDLLTLKKYRHVKIVTVSEFLEILQG